MDGPHNRDPYAFGLGKRANGAEYSFGLGKKRDPYAFGLGKRADSDYAFGMGKKDDPYAFGLGKRADRWVFSKFYNDKSSLHTVELGDKELFGHPKIVP